MLVARRGTRRRMRSSASSAACTAGTSQCARVAGREAERLERSPRPQLALAAAHRGRRAQSLSFATRLRHGLAVDPVERGRPPRPPPRAARRARPAGSRLLDLRQLGPGPGRALRRRSWTVRDHRLEPGRAARRDQVEPVPARPVRNSSSARVEGLGRRSARPRPPAGPGTRGRSRRRARGGAGCVSRTRGWSRSTHRSASRACSRSPSSRKRRRMPHLQLGGRLVGERDREDAVHRHAVLDKPRGRTARRARSSCRCPRSRDEAATRRDARRRRAARRSARGSCLAPADGRIRAPAAERARRRARPDRPRSAAGSTTSLHGLARRLEHGLELRRRRGSRSLTQPVAERVLCVLVQKPARTQVFPAERLVDAAGELELRVLAPAAPAGRRRPGGGGPPPSGRPGTADLPVL